jgi:hypothetical protein
MINGDGYVLYEYVDGLKHKKYVSWYEYYNGELHGKIRWDTILCSRRVDCEKKMKSKSIWLLYKYLIYITAKYVARVHQFL